MEDTTLLTNSGFGALDYGAIVIYMLLTFGIALWFGRRQSNVDDFFVGGRRMPWFAVGLSILGTLFSTLTYLGLPGEMIRNGIGVFAGYLAVPFSMAVVWRLWIPFFMRLRLTSAYEYLERRFDSRVRLAGAGLFVLLRLGWMSMVVFAASMALDRIKGPDLTALPGPDIYWWIGTVGLIAAVYTAVGGIQAMIWTDVLQCALLLSGVVLAIGYVVLTDGTGPRDWWHTASTVSGRNNAPPVFSWDITVRVTIVTAMINNFFWTVCTHGSDQVVLQRYFSTSSLKNARRSYFVNFLVDISMATLLSLAGLALLAFYLRHPDLLQAFLEKQPGLTNGDGNVVRAADRLFPHFLGSQLPAGCAGLIISAFLCDAIQTLESGVNSITAVAASDVVPRLRRGGRRLMSDLTFARVLSMGITVVVAGNACVVATVVENSGETIVGLMPRFFNMFLGPLAGLFISGMFVKRCTARTILPAVACGFLLAFTWSWWEYLYPHLRDLLRLAGLMAPDRVANPTFLLTIALSCSTTVAVATGLSLLFGADGHPGEAWTWRSVMNRPTETEAPPRAG